jgi:membrane-bound metal-dependent hydrolase YbcI (DUF457 family)
MPFTPIHLGPGLVFKAIGGRRFSFMVFGGASFAGAYVGTFSHVALDAVMHADMAPFWPMLDGNPWLSAVSIETLHLACFALGALGLLLVGGQALERRHRGSSTP